MRTQFSRSVNSIHARDVQVLMQHASGPGMISFAGGMPDNRLFPTEELDMVYSALTDQEKRNCFQYGPTAGYPPLLRAVERRLDTKGIPLDGRKLLITTGSLQAISIITQVLIDEGDIILTEDPCFVGALTIFETYGAKIRSVPVDADGIQINALKQLMDELPDRPKFLYVTPNFHNPAGIVYTEKRRKELLEVMSGTGIPIIEDDAYSDLYFSSLDPDAIRPFLCYDPKEVEVIYTGSFSKILGPGFRLGYMLSSHETHSQTEIVKQAIDACTSNLCQILAHRFIIGGYLEPYLEKLRIEYAKRCEQMHTSLKENLHPSVHWNKPQGGFYYWIALPPGLNANELFDRCLLQGVSFVPGHTFDADGTRDDHIRLSFSNTGPLQIEKGVKILGRVMREMMISK